MKPRYLLRLHTYRVLWNRLRWAWSGERECGVCEHDAPCYLSPYVWDEEKKDHVRPDSGD